jgi:septum formation protein
MITMPKFVLASASPRRAEILRTVGWPFEALAANIDESRHAGEDAPSYVKRVARLKAEAVALLSPAATVVGADTVVVVDGDILGKPRDEEDARRMLRQLRGRWHEVLTGIAVFNGKTGQPKVVYQLTEVRFAAMSEGEIDWYVSTGEPMDKAGAYAIQGLGARFVEGIKGEYSNVVGLPVRLLYELLRETSQ